MAYKNYSEKFQQRDLELLKRERDRNVLREQILAGILSGYGQEINKQYFSELSKKIFAKYFETK
jgi:hypothetical protein